MTKGGAGPASKPWPSNGTSRKDRSRKPGAERVEEENVRTEGHATRMVQVACKRLYAQINANFRRGKKQYTRDDKFVQAKLYDIICDEARKLWSQSAVSMVRLNYKHDILANGPRGPADKGPPRIAIMMTWPWCKLALEVRRVHEKYHYSYQTIRNCFARMSYLVWMGGCHVGLVALFGTKEDMQKADLDLYCTPLGGESVVDISLAQDAMSLFGYGDTKGMNKAQVPWAYQKDLKVNCIMNKFEPTEGFCVRVYRVHPSRSGRFKEKFSDEDRLNKLYAEYAEYEDRQQVLERDDSAFPSGAADDSDKYFSPDDIRKDVDKVDIYLQCGAWDYMRAHEEYKEILKRVEQPAAGDGDLLTSGKRKMPGQDIEFNYLAERLQDRITYTHQEVKPPPPPPETDDLYVAGPSPEAEAPSIEPTASPDEILAAYVANAGKPHLQGSLFDGAPELGTTASRGNNRSRRQSYMYKPPKKDVTMGPEPEKYITPEPPSDDVVVQNTLPGSFKLSGEFTDDLADPTSIEFMELASATKGMLEKNLAKELGDSFYAVQITGFKKGSVVAEFVIIMTDDADKKTQKDVAKVIKQVAKNPVAGRTIQADSVDIEAPRSLSRRQSVAPGTEEDEGKKKSKWSAKLSKMQKKPIKIKAVPAEEVEGPPQPQEDVAPIVEQEPQEPRRNLTLWRSLRMRPKPQQQAEPDSGESTDDSLSETEFPDQESVVREEFPDAKEVDLSMPILLNMPEDKRSRSPLGGTPKHSPIPVKRVTSTTSDLPLPEAVHLKRYDSSSVMNALQYGEEHVEPIRLNAKKQKPPKIKLIEKRKSPDVSSKKSKDSKKKPKSEAKIKSTEPTPIPPAEQMKGDYIEFRRKDPVTKQTQADDVQKLTLQECRDDPTVFNMPIVPADRPRSRISMVELANVLAKKQQLKKEEDKEPEEQIIEKAPAFNLPIVPAAHPPTEEDDVETTEITKQQQVEDRSKPWRKPLALKPNFGDVAHNAMMEFGGSKKKKDSAKKSAMEETERKPSMKSSMKRSSLKKKSLAQDEQSDAQSVALDLGDSASVQRYELAPYDSAMDTMQHDRDQGLFPVRGNFDSRPHDGLAEVYVDGDWEDHTQPPMESAPPADMQKSSMPRRVYAASDVSSMIATWSFDPEWGSIDLPPSEIGEEITPTRPTEIESSMVVTRAVTPDEEDEISDRDSVSSDNTEDSRFTVVPLELEPEDKERMRVKLPGEIIAPVVAKSKKKGGDPAANGDDKGCVVM
ncbi:Hypp8658 [Branchiostoma lanceolatum]|uniref:Hypp8658 protein n=1 Tax=Branchiostoma lanceolatum TaxID=7740 RepID=A0A8J9Z881_BRALA|nr:Hypp8658 [Branchiostoma lanceolatum]